MRARSDERGLRIGLYIRPLTVTLKGNLNRLAAFYSMGNGKNCKFHEPTSND